MSLWEGWAKLENLELNLDALEKEFGALPLRITNGNIRALKISLPWTRLMQEPIRVHASCLGECSVVRLLPLASPYHHPLSYYLTEIAVELKEPGETEPKPEVEKAEPSERSPSPSEFEIVESPGAGYLDTLISRVVNNIVFQLENVIVKYSADGVVLTFHIQGITFAPCDQSWQEAFLGERNEQCFFQQKEFSRQKKKPLPDLLPDPELVLRRKLQIKDFTICLDQRTEGGDIKVFQVRKPKVKNPSPSILTLPLSKKGPFPVPHGSGASNHPLLRDREGPRRRPPPQRSEHEGGGCMGGASSLPLSRPTSRPPLPH